MADIDEDDCSAFSSMLILNPETEHAVIDSLKTEMVLTIFDVACVVLERVAHDIARFKTGEDIHNFLFKTVLKVCKIIHPSLNSDKLGKEINKEWKKVCVEMLSFANVHGMRKYTNPANLEKGALGTINLKDPKSWRGWDIIAIFNEKKGRLKIYTGDGELHMDIIIH